MKVQYTKNERMGQYGGSLLRILQNETIPLIDLFIREGLQNSLDATLKDAEETIVDVGAVNFAVHDLAEHFEDIGKTLKERYEGEQNKAIYLSDKNTSGLTGAIRDEDNINLEESKIYKLIYGISMNQTESGTGGSWGLGKTSFFRIGNGIVIYYTRVLQEDGKYEERLAASLIEDSKKSDALLKNNSRGIAWWGERISNDEDMHAETYPIINEKEIESILSVFGIERYAGNETGTTIVVPFINEEKIISHDETHEEESGVVKTSRWWEAGLQERIEIAVQKWYGPRIMNVDYQNKYGSYLLPSINGEVLSPDKFQTFFKKIWELYTCALRGESNDQIIVEPIEIARMALATDTDKIVGDLAFARLDDTDLEMTSPDNNPHPLSYLGYTQKDDLLTNNAKIIAYARKPGMIIDYDVDGIWSQNVSNLENEFIIGFFVPRSDQPLHEEYQGGLNVLDDYLRRTENADHAKWEDVLVNDKKVTIVRRIQGKIIEKLRREFEEEINNKYTSKASLLGRKLGSTLLPSTSHGKRGVPPIDTGEEGNKGEKRNFFVDIKEVRRSYVDKLSVNLQIEIKGKTNGTVSINVNMGSNNYTVQKWLNEMGQDSDYPFKIINLKVLSVDGEEKDIDYEDLNGHDRFNLLLSSFNQFSSFDISNNSEDSPLKIDIEILLAISDPLMQPYIQAKEVK